MFRSQGFASVSVGQIAEADIAGSGSGEQSCKKTRFEDAATGVKEIATRAARLAKIAGLW